MSLNEIMERFTLVSGLGMQEVSRYLPIVKDCKEYLESRIRGELSDADSRRAAYACAVYAYCRISLIGRFEELSSFKAGDVQMQINTSSAAQQLWEEVRGSVSDIIDLSDLSGEFAFRSVSV